MLVTRDLKLRAKNLFEFFIVGLQALEYCPKTRPQNTASLWRSSNLLWNAVKLEHKDIQSSSLMDLGGNIPNQTHLHCESGIKFFFSKKTHISAAAKADSRATVSSWFLYWLAFYFYIFISLNFPPLDTTWGTVKVAELLPALQFLSTSHRPAQSWAGHPDSPSRISAFLYLPFTVDAVDLFPSTYRAVLASPDAHYPLLKVLYKPCWSLQK